MVDYHIHEKIYDVDLEQAESFSLMEFLCDVAMQYRCLAQSKERTARLSDVFGEFVGNREKCHYHVHDDTTCPRCDGKKVEKS